MESIGMFEARTKFSEFIRAVAEEGRGFVITNRGEEMARLIPARPIATSERVANALKKFAAIRASVVQPLLLPGESLKDLGREGLKW